LSAGHFLQGLVVAAGGELLVVGVGGGGQDVVVCEGRVRGWVREEAAFDFSGDGEGGFGGGFAEEGFHD
jgi:hypothetical protein